MMYNGMSNQQGFQNQNNFGYNTMPDSMAPVSSINRGTVDVIVTIDSDQQAINYPVGPGYTIMFIDFNRKIFHLKTTDTRGMQQPMLTYSFSEVKPKPTEDRQYQNDQLTMPVNYVEQQEFDGLKKSVAELNNSISEMYKMLEDLTAPGK